jgi:hypothetical protein
MDLPHITVKPVSIYCYDKPKQSITAIFWRTLSYIMQCKTSVTVKYLLQLREHLPAELNENNNSGGTVGFYTGLQYKVAYTLIDLCSLLFFPSATFLLCSYFNNSSLNATN